MAGDITGKCALSRYYYKDRFWLAPAGLFYPGKNAADGWRI